MMPQQLSSQSTPPPPAGSALVLSARDVERLLTEETPDARIDVLRKVAESHTQRRYSLKEFIIAEQIFRVLLRDTEISVRESLASALRDNPQVPRDIILALARDIDSVAQPILESSAVLSDEDLIALINSAKQTGKPAAVAKRAQLSEAVATALVETRNSKAVSQLVKNPGAQLSTHAYEEIVRDYSKNTDVMDAVAVRPDLPATVVEKIIILVSDSIADSLRVQYNISPATIAQETEKTRELATLKLVDDHHGNPREVEKLIDQLQVFGRLTPSIILTSLCRGNLYFFETSLARLSNIPVRNAQLLIHDKGGRGFQALYAKAGLPDKFFAACKMLLEVLFEMHHSGQKSTGKAHSDAVVSKLLARSSGKNVENLSYIIALIRQNA